MGFEEVIKGGALVNDLVPLQKGGISPSCSLLPSLPFHRMVAYTMPCRKKALARLSIHSKMNVSDILLHQHKMYGPHLHEVILGMVIRMLLLRLKYNL